MSDVVDQVVTTPFEELVERLRREAGEGYFHTAAQACVLLEGEAVLDVAVGQTHRHEPFALETLSALYCTAKPLVAVAALVLIADDELSLDDRLGDVIDGLDVGWMAERTVEEVLAHTAGLHPLNTVLARILPESQRETWMNMMPPPEGWRFGVDRSYSEFGGWFLLGRVIEEISGEPYGDFVRSRVVEPYGIDPAELIVRFAPEATGPESFEALSTRISATYDLTMAQPIPLLAEVGPETATEWNPSFGSYGTMRAMAAFYEALLGDLRGDAKVLPTDLLAQATEARLPLTDDVTLGRAAGFGLGFMAPLSSHYFGNRPSATAFGHAGQGGTSFAMGDPERGLAVAMLFNAGLDADTALTFRRVNLVDAVYRAVEQLG